MKVAFDIVSAQDGSRHVIERFGEALDSSDKATAKAMTAAYKSAIFLALCIPSLETEDPDAWSIRLKSENVIEPAQGWTLWAQELLAAIAEASTGETIDELQVSSRAMLRALAMHEVALYASIGDAIRERRRKLGEAESSANVNGVRPGAASKKSARRPRANMAVHA